MVAAKAINDQVSRPPAKATNDQVSKPQKTLLDDTEVSRMMAAKALDDWLFRQQLFGHSENRKDFRAIHQVIPTFRQEIVYRAKLRVPYPPSELSTYLKKNTNSRVLLSRAMPLQGNGDKATSVEEKGEWGWVVSYLSCLEMIMNSLVT